MDPPDITETSGLRHRSTGRPPSPHHLATTTSVSSPDSPELEPELPPAQDWNAQLSAARQALASRLGPEFDPDFAEPEAEPPVREVESGTDAGLGDVGEKDRRGSAGSEGDDEVVREMLRGVRNSGPETVTEEGEGMGAPSDDEAPGAFMREEPVDAAPKDDRMCRICFDGEDEELGRLFSPCQCRGTSSFVHVECLNRWRMASAGATGFVANGLLYTIEKRTASLTGSPFEDIFVSDYVIVGESMREAVEFFGKTVDKSGWNLKAIADKEQADEDNSWLGRFGGSSGKKKRQAEKEAALKPPIVRRLVEHFIKGFSLVGITAFFQTFVATALMGPFGLRGSLFRAVRPNRRNGDNQTNFSQIIIVLLVLVGVVKAVQSTYKAVQWGTKKALTRVEAMVLDV
ncbi:hypothetical protein P7C70_g7578, partial [Phenoliferia sp. Uapishka_3]